MERDLGERGHASLDAAIDAGHQRADAVLAVILERERVQTLDRGREHGVDRADAHPPREPVEDREQPFARKQQDRERRLRDARRRNERSFASNRRWTLANEFSYVWACATIFPT